MITKIELPLHSSFPTVNCYLVEGEKLTLIDAGKSLKGNWEIFQQAIQKAGFRVPDIDQVILTHEHTDHIGLLPEILANSQASVVAPKIIKEHLLFPDEMAELNHQFMTKEFATFGFSATTLTRVFKMIERLRRKSVATPLNRLQFFEPNDTLLIEDSEWKALHTPGHCPSQFCFLQENSKRCFGGDMLLEIIPMPIAIEDPNQPGKRMASIPALMQSFKKLKGYNIQLNYPGHGQIFENANSYIDQQMARLQERKEECYQAIKAGHHTIAQITKFLYPKVPMKNMPVNLAGLFMTLGYLDLLEEEGRVKVEMEGNMLLYR